MVGTTLTAVADTEPPLSLEPVGPQDLSWSSSKTTTNRLWRSQCSSTTGAIRASRRRSSQEAIQTLGRSAASDIRDRDGHRNRRPDARHQ